MRRSDLNVSPIWDVSSQNYSLKTVTIQRRDLSVQTMLDMLTTLLKVALYKTPKKGVEFGPDKLREYDLIKKLKRLSVNVIDTGNLKLPDQGKEIITNNIKNSEDVGNGNKILSDAVHQELKKGHNVLVLGGDHSLGIGSVHGNILGTDEPPIVLWIDAHSDINTSLTSPSGNAHGMPVSFFLEETRSTIPKTSEFSWISASLKGKDVVFIGLRDIDSGEVEILQKYGIKYFSMQEVDAYGIKDVLQLALDMADPTGTRPIHVSFDIDSMDPMFTPSTGTPVPGGLTLRECLYMAEKLHDTGRLSVVDIVELNVSLGNSEDKDKTVANTIRVIEHFYGNKRAGVVMAE